MIFSLVTNQLFICFSLLSINKKEMKDKRIRISFAEKRKYCELIRSGASYKSLNLIFKSKHKTVLPRRTFYNWTRDKDAVLERTSTTKINLDSGRKSEAMKKFEEEIKKKVINRLIIKLIYSISLKKELSMATQRRSTWENRKKIHPVKDLKATIHDF